MTERTWWNRENRPYETVELIADGIVHTIGIVVALVAGTVLLTLAATHTAPELVPALAVYVGSLVVVLSVSFVFNMWPATPFKRFLARFDQAAIFLFMAGSYTPFLSLLGGTPFGTKMMIWVWSASLVGIALKLIVPKHFGRMAILLYLAIGWSGLLVFGSLATALPSTALWLLLAGGIVYSLGIIFHLWETLRFQNALWHVFVVTGATLHLGAIIDCIVISRL